MDDVWVEKYRPQVLDEVVGQEAITERLKVYVKEKTLPHLLFAGSAGTGKTTCAIVVARSMFEDNWKMNFHELNASDERGIDVVRTKIKEFARTAPMGDSKFKIIFLDEADALTHDAQAALRRTMEKYTRTCRFILSCNYSSKIIDPIQSRCAMFRFRAVSEEALRKRLRFIVSKENIKITDSGFKALWHVSRGDLRKGINILQIASTVSEEINDETIYKVLGLAKREDIEVMIKTALKGKFTEARELLERMLIEQGVSGEDIIKQIHRQIYYLSIPDREKVVLLDKTGEMEFRIVEGSNEHIQLAALLAYFTMIGENLR